LIPSATLQNQLPASGSIFDHHQLIQTIDLLNLNSYNTSRTDEPSQPINPIHFGGSAMRIRTLLAISCFLIVLPAAPALDWTAARAASIEVPRISTEQANQMRGDPDVIFIDVRTAKSWWRSTAKITHAIREEPDAVVQWAPKYGKNKTLILYCA
jgi:hypothetical protein